MKKYLNLIKNNLQTALFILVFVLLIPVLGVTCIYKYWDFKVNNRIDYTEWIAAMGSKLETDIASSFYRKFDFVNLNGAIRNVLHQQEMNYITKLDNGRLMQVFNEAPDESVIEKHADNTLRLQEFLEQRGIPLLFVTPPYGVSPYDPQLPAGVTDYSNAYSDLHLKYLRERGIDTLDLREELHRDGIDQYDMMYKTDHHWNTDAGFYAFGKIADWLVKKTGCYIDPRIADISQYERSVYPEHHLGMYGQRTGKYFGGIDDFVLYTPKFNSLIQKVGTEETGTLEAVFLDKAPLEDADHTSRYTYDEVLGGLPVDSYEYICHTSGNDMNLLVISDSFFKAIAPYLIMGFSDVTYVHYSETAIYTEASFLDAHQYDAVILLYDPGIIDGSGTPFQFLDGF